MNAESLIEVVTGMGANESGTRDNIRGVDAESGNSATTNASSAIEVKGENENGIKAVFNHPITFK